MTATTDTRAPRPIRWPRRAAAVAEATTLSVVAAATLVLGVAVSALAGVESARPALLVASGFVVGAAVRIAKDARQLWATYRNWRGERLDHVCERLDIRRYRRRWDQDTPSTPTRSTGSALTTARREP